MSPGERQKKKKNGGNDRSFVGSLIKIFTSTFLNIMPQTIGNPAFQESCFKFKNFKCAVSGLLLFPSNLFMPTASIVP